MSEYDIDLQNKFMCLYYGRLTAEEMIGQLDRSVCNVV